MPRKVLAPHTPTPEEMWNYFQANNAWELTSKLSKLTQMETIEVVKWVVYNKPTPEVLDFLIAIS